MRLSIGLEAIASYKRLSYSTWHALAEFVDNSTQAYFDNREVLDAQFKKEGSRLTVSILYDRDRGEITIRDNAIGMSEAELDEALKIAARPPKDGGRSRYGMGMKTAACWFGDEWRIETKKLNSPSAITITVDVPAVAAGDGELNPVVRPAPVDAHYTEITISKLHRRLHGKGIGVIKNFLRSMYRCDLREDVLELLFQGEPLTWEGFENRILLDDDLDAYKRALDFEVCGKQVSGWVAVLKSGGRPFGGFSILQSKRVIKGYPDAWRPRSLFGQEEGSNDVINQRLCGELHLNGFQVSHTKDDIIWEGDEEDEIEKKLVELCDDYRRVARNLRKGDRRRPSQLAVDNAINQIATELSAGEMVDVLNLTEIPPEDVLKKTSQQTVERASRNRPRMTAQLGDMEVKLYMDSDASPSDPYYALDLRADGTVEVAINWNHDYMVQLGDEVADFIRQCVYDGIAEYKATQKKGTVTADTVRFLKDNLLRIPYRVHDDAPESVPDVDQNGVPVEVLITSEF